jgi:hypothetical protein
MNSTIFTSEGTLPSLKLVSLKSKLMRPVFSFREGPIADSSLLSYPLSSLLSSLISSLLSGYFLRC